MASKNKFDLTLTEFRGHVNQYPGRDVGIEVELEGSLKNISSPLWSVHNEPSLREGGMEFVLKQPLAYNEIDKALFPFDICMKASIPKPSIRCSTHMHINVMSFTIREIYNVMAAWYLLEPLIVSTQSSNRQGNLFCLRLQDAEDIFQSIVDSIRTENYVNQFVVERNRYAALNLVATTKYGSLEFRFLDAITSGGLLKTWVDIFYHICQTARVMTPKVLLQTYDDLSPKEFVAKMTTKDSARFITQDLSDNAINHHLHTNYDYVFELCQLLATKKFQMPKKYWQEDLEVPLTVGFDGTPTTATTTGLFYDDAPTLGINPLGLHPPHGMSLEDWLNQYGISTPTHWEIIGGAQKLSWCRAVIAQYLQEHPTVTPAHPLHHHLPAEQIRPVGLTTKQWMDQFGCVIPAGWPSLTADGQYQWAQAVIATYKNLHPETYGYSAVAGAEAAPAAPPVISWSDPGAVAFPWATAAHLPNAPTFIPPPHEPGVAGAIDEAIEDWFNNTVATSPASDDDEEF